MPTIKTYDPIIAILRSKLLADNELSTWSGWTNAGAPDIYPAYLSFVENANYPSLTICREDGITLKNRTGYQSLTYYIHGWFKQSDSAIIADNPVDDAGFLLNKVIEAFIIKFLLVGLKSGSIEGGFHLEETEPAA